MTSFYAWGETTQSCFSMLSIIDWGPAQLQGRSAQFFWTRQACQLLCSRVPHAFLSPLSSPLVTYRHFLVQISFQIQPAPRTRHVHRLGNLQRPFAAYFWSVEHLDHHYEANHQSRFHLAHNKYINAESVFDSAIEGILYQAQVRIKW
mgnify:CR=1 FL=1